jgi:hypothetical protein
MNVKQLIVFFSVCAVFFLFIIIYNVYASANNNHRNDGNAYAKTSLKPKYTPKARPAGAPKMVKTEAEAEALLAQN